VKYRTLEVETHHGVGIVWMNRREVRNAFNDVMIAELTSAFRALEAEREVRAVVLAGRGPAFCAGADLNWMKKMAGNSFAHNYEDALGLARMLHAIDTLSKPTVARVHGAAFAGGMGLIAACDIAVAAQDAEFCVSEAKLGLIPATIGPYVIAAMGERAARRYFLSAERFTAAEAYRIGFVQELVLPQELDDVINRILGDLVQGGPGALAATKELIHSVAGARIDESLIADTAKRIATVRASAEGKEGVRAFLEKRSASWVPVPDQPADSARASKRPAKARKT
jgi:methylglutaconyl-CoA hydratase